MQTYKYYDNPETLSVLQKMPKIDRERWHTRRIAKEQKAYALFDLMTKSTVLLDSSLQEELEEVREEVIRTKNSIALRTDAKFKLVLREYHRTLEHFRQTAAAGQPTLLKYLKGKQELRVVLTQLRREEILVDMLTVYELQIEKICLAYNVNPQPYFQLGHVLEVTRGIATRKLMEEHFGYSR